MSWNAVDTLKHMDYSCLEGLFVSKEIENFQIPNTSVTFATAAVRSYISTVSRNSTAAAVFLRLHTLAVTFATAALRRKISLNLWRQKNCGCPTFFEVMTHGRRRASLRQP